MEKEGGMSALDFAAPVATAAQQYFGFPVSQAQPVMVPLPPKYVPFQPKTSFLDPEGRSVHQGIQYMWDRVSQFADRKPTKEEWTLLYQDIKNIDDALRIYDHITFDRQEILTLVDIRSGLTALKFSDPSFRYYDRSYIGEPSYGQRQEMVTQKLTDLLNGISERPEWLNFWVKWNSNIGDMLDYPHSENVKIVVDKFNELLRTVALIGTPDPQFEIDLYKLVTKLETVYRANPTFLMKELADKKTDLRQEVNTLLRQVEKLNKGTKTSYRAPKRYKEPPLVEKIYNDYGELALIGFTTSALLIGWFMTQSRRSRAPKELNILTNGQGGIDITADNDKITISPENAEETIRYLMSEKTVHFADPVVTQVRRRSRSRSKSRSRRRSKRSKSTRRRH